MCGIFAFISSDEIDVEAIKLESDKLSARGPDSSKEISMKIGDKNIYLAFHRLAINGLDEKSDQPMNLLNLKSIYLLCNGEIYNYKSLAKKYKIDLETNSDCEIIIHLYNKLPVDKFIRELDGVFSFVICDKDKQMILIGHDPIGVRPLYWYHTGKELALSSEMKGLSSLNNSIDFYPPGSYSYYKMGQIMKSLNTYSYYTFDYPLNSDSGTGKFHPRCSSSGVMSYKASSRSPSRHASSAASMASKSVPGAPTKASCVRGAPAQMPHGPAGDAPRAPPAWDQA